MTRPNRGRADNHAVVVRLRDSEQAKLEALAEATGRYPAQVIRQLIALAEPAGEPDLILKARPGDGAA